MGIENLKNTNKTNKKKLVISIIKVIVLATIVIGIPIYIFIFYGDWLKSIESIDDVVQFLRNYESESMLVYIGLQILQIVISFIPGQAFQMAAGYLYGFWIALGLAMAGAIIGTAITFFLAKILGRDFLHILFGEEKMKYYIEKLNSKKAYTIVFLIYLIPGIPKDMVSYAAGVSEIHFKPFVILSAVGRLPGMIGCLLMGKMLESKNYTGFIIIAVIAIIAFVLCIIFKKKLQSIIDKVYEKIS